MNLTTILFITLIFRFYIYDCRAFIAHFLDHISVQKIRTFGAGTTLNVSRRKIMYKSIQRSPENIKSLFQNTAVLKFMKKNNSVNDILGSEKASVSLSLDPTIVVVEDENSLETMKAHFEEKPEVLGIDCEWKPCSNSQFSPVSILQISSGDMIFLVDLFHWCEPRRFHNNKMTEKEERLNSVLNLVLPCPNIRKVGFGACSDLQKLAFSYPHIPCFNFVNSVIELELIFRVAFSVPLNTNTGGLSYVCNRMLGFLLDKQAQCSNWGARPLSVQQISYAAVDAFVCVILFLVLKKKIEKGELNMKSETMSGFGFWSVHGSLFKVKHCCVLQENTVPQLSSAQKTVIQLLSIDYIHDLIGFHSKWLGLPLPTEGPMAVVETKHSIVHYFGLEMKTAKHPRRMLCDDHQTVIEFCNGGALFLKSCSKSLEDRSFLSFSQCRSILCWSLPNKGGFLDNRALRIISMLSSCSPNLLLFCCVTTKPYIFCGHGMLAGYEICSDGVNIQIFLQDCKDLSKRSLHFNQIIERSPTFVTM